MFKYRSKEQCIFMLNTCMCVHVVACIPGANESSVTSTIRQATDLIKICNK